jgi:hypothetical protein
MYSFSPNTIYNQDIQVTATTTAATAAAVTVIVDSR